MDDSRKREFLEGLTALLVKYDCRLESIARGFSSSIEVNWGESHKGTPNWTDLGELINGDGFDFPIKGIE